MNLLDIKNLTVSVKDKKVLDDVSISVNKGEVHVILGPNGSGKSSLSMSIMGNPKYKIESGEVLFSGERINDLPPDERAKKGIFLCFQQVQEIEGLVYKDYLRELKTKVKNERPDLMFNMGLSKNFEDVGLNESHMMRYLNDGFSGGEKKKSELLQMKFLNPNLIILDEIDSGLDIDAIKSVCSCLKDILNEDKAVIIITHREEVIRELNVTHVHVLRNGRHVKTGDIELFNEINKNGYSGILKEN